MSDAGPWVTLALLGAFHGLNPAMGWLFAVALGLQERRRGAVLEALPPIALGHAASIATVVLAVGVAQRFIAADILRTGGGLLLMSFGVYKLATRFRHPRWVGMRVGFRDLTLWSFLMSSAHGAGLMLVPVLLRMPARPMTHHAVPSDHPAGRLGDVGGTAAITGIEALGVHTAALLVVMAGAALLVFEIVGLELLRRAWINLDLIWAGALIVAGLVTLLM